MTVWSRNNILYFRIHDVCQNVFAETQIDFDLDLSMCIYVLVDLVIQEILAKHIYWQIDGWMDEQR